MSFGKAVQFTLKIEGGYNNDKDDKGGETNLGVTASTLQEAIRRGIVPKDTSVKGLTNQKALLIYKALFWDRFSLDSVPWPISLIVFDTAVQHGQGNMTGIVQNAVNATNKARGVALISADKRWGPLTQAAVSSLAHLAATEFATNLIKERKATMDRIFTKTPSQLKWKNGWYNRLTNLSKECGVPSPIQ